MIIIHTGMNGGCGIIESLRIISKTGCGKKRLSLVLLAACLLLLLAGCGAASANEVSRTETEQNDPFANIVPAEIADTRSGVSDMSALVKDYKQAVESDQADVAKSLADQIAGLWKAIQAEAQKVDPELYALIQNDMGQLLAETKVDDWNKDLLIDLDYKLYQSIRDLKQKLQD
ncbi:hypothetical protein [Paenibacillus sp. YIM B09110]|uniref:hypothetical protein n=1 Tax=Paenibacillus sp. YIM B09110 TaxID=3126102 RepID=UPI00301CD07B